MKNKYVAIGYSDLARAILSNGGKVNRYKLTQPNSLALFHAVDARDILNYFVRVRRLNFSETYLNKYAEKIDSGKCFHLIGEIPTEITLEAVDVELED